MAARPLVLPDPFSGNASWDQWIYHFESVAEVNTWDGEQKLKLLMSSTHYCILCCSNYCHYF